MSGDEMTPTSTVTFQTRLSYQGERPETLHLRGCKLVVTSAEGVREHVLDADVVTIGTAEDSAVVLDDPTVSRKHCEIVRKPDGYVVRDAGSTNGVRVDGARVVEAYLTPGCTISLGATTIRFQAADEDIAVVPSPARRFGAVVGASARMRELYTVLGRLAQTDITLLLEGETGTGKELFARAVHDESPRRDQPFIVLDCGATTESLLESELFGHEKGAFTGALGTRKGVFELAHGGTIFLDEIGELPLEQQPRLLRVLERREIKRMGGSKVLRVDVRVIAATNRRLEREVAAKRFREDLFHRLHVAALRIPALRERRDDVPHLVEHFLETGRYNRATDGGRRVKRVTRGALDRLCAYEWPGNVRELQNVIQRAVTLCARDTLDVVDLPEHVAREGLAEPPSVAEPKGHGVSPSAESITVGLAGSYRAAKDAAIEAFEHAYLVHLLARHEMNVSAAAREAEMDRKYMRRLMRKHGIRGEDDADTDVDDR